VTAAFDHRELAVEIVGADDSKSDRKKLIAGFVAAAVVGRTQEARADCIAASDHFESALGSDPVTGAATAIGIGQGELAARDISNSSFVDRQLDSSWMIGIRSCTETVPSTS
jgi:hypothetical protein